MAVLDTPARSRALNPAGGDARSLPGGPTLRRDPVPDLRDEFGRRRGVSRMAAELDEEEEGPGLRRRRGLRLKVRGSIPTSLAGRIAAAVLVLAGFGGIAYGLHEAQLSLLHDSRLVIPSSRAIEIAGNNHLSRAQLLSVFGGDVDRNVLTVPLTARRAELESLPWVEHATVMRLLPNRVRVAIVERTPVAFVRQGSEIGLVDEHGVLLDLSPEAAADHAYSFPVLSGVSAADPASTRAARMRLYLGFASDLDAGTEKVSQRLSEVDLTDPEDVKALIADNGADVLVHFGDRDFLPRYQRYEQNLADWKTKYPKLASVDMRYEHEVVLEMAPGASVPGSGDSGTASLPTARPASAVKAASAKGKPELNGKPLAKAAPAAKNQSVPHLQKSFDVRSKPGQVPPGQGPR